jgi:hypothetical protein
MSKEATPMFQRRPQLDRNAFVQDGEITSPAEAKAAAAPGSRLKQGNGTHSYKHKSANYLRLRRLAQRLDVNIGDLLDEAIEAKMPEFDERAGKVEW